MKYLLLILLVSCSKKEEVKNELTLSQKEFYNQASLEFRAYIDSCMMTNGYSYAYCYREFKEISKEKIQVSNRASIGEIAVGTAIGGVATKIITGK